jgi:hypothetical protein
MCLKLGVDIESALSNSSPESSSELTEATEPLAKELIELLLLKRLALDALVYPEQRLALRRAFCKSVADNLG